MATSWHKTLWGIALLAFVLGSCGALARGFWGASDDCLSWVNGNRYQLVRDDWWAKDRGCVARTPGGDEVVHSEEFGNKATGWAWQFGIFALGAMPAAAMVVYVSRRPE
jgi:hypothetical protein